MTYCISDIHGCYAEFMELLEKINFSIKDTLYVLGDMIDRGEASLEVMQHIMETPNMHALMGNHEWMLLDYYDTSIQRSRYDWLANGGEEVSLQIMAMELTSAGMRDWEKMLEWLKGLPLYKFITVNGNDFL